MSTPETTAVTAPEIVITPPSRWSALSLRELWEHRELIYFLTKRELQIRYKQSFFGISWALLQPIVLAFIFAVLFGNLITFQTEIDYPVFVVAGIVPWLFTAQAVTNSANSLVQDSDLISKVYFPRLALPIAKAMSLVIDLVISFAVVLAMALIYDVGIASTFWLAPAFVLLGVLTTFALGSLFAAVNVKYRDVQLVVPMVVQIMFFLTPVFYPTAQLIKGDWIYLYAVNPMATVIDGLRWALFGTARPSDAVIAISVASALLLTVAALSYFKRTEHYFADIV